MVVVWFTYRTQNSSAEVGLEYESNVFREIGQKRHRMSLYKKVIGVESPKNKGRDNLDEFGKFVNICTQQ